MSIFKKLFSTVTSPLGLVKDIASVVDRFVTTGDEKLAFASKRAEFEADLLGLVSARDSEIEQTLRTEIQAKERVLVAELQQGDNYTKRARPTVVYAGLAIAFVNYVLLPWVAHFAGLSLPEINVPTEFWVGWSGIVATWVIGRSAERRGLQNKVVESITGNRASSLLGD